jgi:hypothetical protein
MSQPAHRHNVINLRGATGFCGKSSITPPWPDIPDLDCVLQGRVLDQAHMLGVLNQLCTFGLTLCSVEAISRADVWLCR